MKHLMNLTQKAHDKILELIFLNYCKKIIKDMLYSHAISEINKKFHFSLDDKTNGYLSLLKNIRDDIKKLYINKEDFEDSELFINQIKPEDITSSPLWYSLNKYSLKDFINTNDNIEIIDNIIRIKNHYTYDYNLNVKINYLQNELVKIFEEINFELKADLYFVGYYDNYLHIKSNELKTGWVVSKIEKINITNNVLEYKREGEKFVKQIDINKLEYVQDYGTSVYVIGKVTNPLIGISNLKEKVLKAIENRVVLNNTFLLRANSTKNN